MFDESAPALLGAVERLDDEEVWRDVEASLPEVHGAEDIERWLDEHEAAYEVAREVPTPA